MTASRIRVRLWNEIQSAEIDSPNFDEVRLNALYTALEILRTIPNE